MICRSKYVKKRRKPCLCFICKSKTYHPCICSKSPLHVLHCKSKHHPCICKGGSHHVRYCRGKKHVCICISDKFKKELNCKSNYCNLD